jgi:hypothetical protein
MARNCVPFHSYLNESGVGCSRSSHRPNGFSMELAACGHLGLVWARLGSARLGSETSFHDWDWVQVDWGMRLRLGGSGAQASGLRRCPRTETETRRRLQYFHFFSLSFIFFWHFKYTRVQ